MYVLNGRQYSRIPASIGQGGILCSSPQPPVARSGNKWWKSSIAWWLNKSFVKDCSMKKKSFLLISLKTDGTNYVLLSNDNLGTVELLRNERVER